MTKKKHLTVLVLINNAIKIRMVDSEDLSTIRAATNDCFNNGITSNKIITKAFDPLLRKGTNPRVIMVSSVRGSFTRTVNKTVRLAPSHRPFRSSNTNDSD